MRIDVQRRARTGHVLIYMTVAMSAVLGALSLGVDWGLKTLVDTELQTIADAAARAGATRMAELPTILTGQDALSVGAEVRVAATSIGEANPSSGAKVTLRSGDVEVGVWDDDARSFTPSSAPGINAVRVTAERSTPRGNAIETMLARAFGNSQLRSRRSAVARLEALPPYALVGLDYFNSMGVLTVDGSPLYRQGHVASNGDVSLNLLGLLGVSLIDGHIATRANVNLPWLLNLTVIRDGIKRPARPFVLPPVSLDAPTRVNNNGLLGGLLGSDENLIVVGIRDVAPGTYCVHDLTIVAGAVLRVRGPTTIFVSGKITVLGTVLALNDPADIKVRVVGSGPVVVAANVTLSADLYAPDSPVYIAAGVIYRGRLMSKSIDVLGTSLFFLRPELPAPELGRPRVTLVK